MEQESIWDESSEVCGTSCWQFLCAHERRLLIGNKFELAQLKGSASGGLQRVRFEGSVDS